MKSFYNRFKEYILYCLFGTTTFFIDVGGFYLCSLFFDLNNIPWLMHLCSIISTGVAITFSYITNRKFVFKSNKNDKRGIAKEVVEFFFARGISLLLSEILMQISVVNLGYDSSFMKLLINIIVIIINYICSKFWIFKK